MRPLNAEIIRQFVTDEGSEQTIDIDTPRLCFPKKKTEVQEFILLINKENSADGKGYFFIPLKFINF